jgi:phenylacetate-CoA ligase
VSRQPDGSPNPSGVVVRSPSWRYLGNFFETGPEYAFNNSDPVEQQVAWLQELRPHYAMSDPGIFEEWLLASEGRKPVDSLEALIGVGSQLSPSLRTRLEQTFRIPIHQSYGLNEIGMVAVRCSSGRYHVHTEHCLVQIVGGDGRPCEPGETGRLLVTGLRNYAMPLIRYDTGDLAQPAFGPCPCGRTLPSFGEIAGRFRRFAGLPKGTRERFRAIRHAVESYPPDELAFLRRYQVHQDRENRFTLRMRTVAPIPEAFRQAALRAWEPFAGTPPSPLTIVEMDNIPTSPSGKILDFSSEFYTDAYASPQR